MTKEDVLKELVDLRNFRMSRLKQQADIFARGFQELNALDAAIEAVKNGQPGLPIEIKADLDK